MTVNRKNIKAIIFAVGLSCFVFENLSAQNTKISCSTFRDTLLNKLVYTTADQQPEPIGGTEALNTLIAKKLKYPVGDTIPKGTIYVAFVVEANGRIDGKRVVGELKGHEDEISKQLLTIIKEVKWKPALCGGKAVPFLYSFKTYIKPSE